MHLVASLLQPLSGRNISMVLATSVVCLLTVVVSASAAQASVTEDTTTSKWDTSKIWPACATELYNQKNNNSTPVLRTLDAASWQLDFDTTTTSSAQVRRFLDAARFRFQAALDAAAAVTKKTNAVRPVVHTRRINNPMMMDISNGATELHALSGIQIHISSSDDTTLEYGIDESYEIRIVTEDPWIQVNATTVYGAMLGLETLKQLLEFGWTTNGHSIFIIADTPLYIQDAPVYSYRGLMIDTARHYLSLDEIILPNLHVMAANKLNVLHWHLTDSQSWPYKSDAFPEISDHGAAYCETCLYTAADIRRVIQQAAMFGIRVIVEVDLPGHCQAIGKSHPELMSHCEGKPSEPLDVTKPAVNDFVAQLYDEVTELFPDSWIHIGGDEVSLDCWKNSSEIQQWMREHNMTTEVELLEYFELNLIDTVISKTKRPIVWEDLFDAGLQLPKSTVIDLWILGNIPYAAQNATLAGYDVLFSAGWYLDHLQQDWWPFHQWNPAFGLSPEQQKHLLGGHASMWGELVDNTNFMMRVWPRASSMAEVLWSGSPSNNTFPTQSLVEKRLARFRCHIIRLYDIPASPVGPGYCEEVDRPQQRNNLGKEHGIDTNYIQSNTKNFESIMERIQEGLPHGKFDLHLSIAVDGIVLCTFMAWLVLNRKRRPSSSRRAAAIENNNSGRDNDAFIKRL